MVLADPVALRRAAATLHAPAHRTGAVPGWDGPARAAYDDDVARRAALRQRLEAALAALRAMCAEAARLAEEPLGVRAGLGEGDAGEDVRRLQRALAAAGHPCGAAGADGVLGPATRSALLALQTACRLPPTGVADPGTLRALGPGAPTGLPAPAAPVRRAHWQQVAASGATGGAAARAGSVQRWSPTAVRAEAGALLADAPALEAARRALTGLTATPVPARLLPAVSAALGEAGDALTAAVDELVTAAGRLRSAADGQEGAEASVAAALAAVDRLRVPDPAAPAAAPAASGAGDGAALARWARRFVGTPYVWGGSSPAGFDCSGLTSYVYAHAGVVLPRTSQEQSAAFPVFTDPAQLRPGDLVFTEGGAGSAGHVVLYLGDGQVLSAPSPGECVRVQAIWGPWCAAHVLVG